MWTALSLAAMLPFAPASSGRLAIEHLRATYGVMGPERQGNQILPGDMLVLAFDISGLEPGADGKVRYGIGLEMTDPAGKTRFRQEPTPHPLKPSGSGSLPAVARLHAGLDQPPGLYTIKITVADGVSNASRSVSRMYEVLPKGFGLVELFASGKPDSPAIVPFQPGKPGVVRFAVVGFERDPARHQPDLRVVMEVRDQDGRAALSEPTVGEVKADMPEKALTLPVSFQLEISRPGKFTVSLKGEDRISRRTATLSFPLIVEIPK